MPVSESHPGGAPERVHDLHAVRTADSAGAAGAESAPMTRWEAIVGERGGTYWQHLRDHLWVMLLFAIGFLSGVLSVK